jgi:hypothetical protein
LSQLRQHRPVENIDIEDEILEPNYRGKLRYEGVRDIVYNATLFGVCLGYALGKRDVIEKVCAPEVQAAPTWLIV